MYWFVWSFFSRVEVCRHEDRFVALLRSFYRPAYCVGGGVSLLFGRLLPLDLWSLWGRGLRNGVPYGWLLIRDEKTTRTAFFSRFMFLSGVDVHQWLSWRVSWLSDQLIYCGVGFRLLAWWAWVFWCSRMQESLMDVGYGSREPPIDTHDPSVKGFFFFCFIFARCPPSGLCLLWRLGLGMGWIGYLC